MKSVKEQQTENNETNNHLPIKPGPNEHQLQYPYCFWFSKRPSGKNVDAAAFEKTMKIIGTFCTVSYKLSINFFQ